jgi:predicted nucleic acid-binding protein
MSGRSFLDTNIFVYSHDFADPRKQSIANDLIRSVTVSGEGAISYQVIQEFFNVALRKSSSKLSHEDALRYLATTFRPLLAVPSSLSLVSDAIRIQERYRLSWYDSLIVSAAQQAGCHTLYSEDLQHGQQFGAVTVHDPFR